jgi:hypothetical protein
MVRVSQQMERERLKLIVKNLKLLVESLEAEVYSDPDKYVDTGKSKSIYTYSDDDDDGYAD